MKIVTLFATVLFVFGTSSVYAVTDPYEPDNFQSSATTIQAGTVSASYNIIPNDDVDWVKFTLTQIENIEIKTTGPTLGGIQMTLFDSNLTVIKDDGNFGHPKIKREALPVGTYYARIKHYPGDGEVTHYNIVFSTTAANGDQFEPNNVSADAITLQPGTTSGLNIIPENDYDWMKFTIDSLRDVELTTSGPEPGMEMTLYDSNLTILKNHRSFGYANIRQDALEAGTYFVKLSTYPVNHGPINNYNINLNLLAGSSVFDVDGDGSVQALTDGLLILRYKFGFTGDALINGSVSNNATRATAIQIETYLQSKMP